MNAKWKTKLIDLFQKIRDILTTDEAIVDTVWFEGSTTLYEELGFWVDDIARGKYNLEQKTTEELREQFEKNYLYQSCIPTIRTNFPKNIHGKYKFSTDQMKWECYQACARANKILKERGK